MSDIRQVWVRVRSNAGQFDIPEGTVLRDGWELVPDYPKHVGRWARPSKARIESGRSRPESVPVAVERSAAAKDAKNAK